MTQMYVVPEKYVTLCKLFHVDAITDKEYYEFKKPQEELTYIDISLTDPTILNLFLTAGEIMHSGCEGTRLGNSEFELN